MKTPRFFLKFLLLALNLAVPLIAAIDKIEERGRPVSECIDWDDLLQDPSQEETFSDSGGALPLSPVAPKEERLTIQKNEFPLAIISEQQKAAFAERKQIFADLSAAFRQAYARGDENHPDWNLVVQKIEQLVPKNVTTRRLSGASDQEKEVDIEQVQYHFFSETLPAIKKASVIAALLCRANNFETAELCEKTAGIQQAWEEAKANFEKVLKNYSIHPDQSATSTAFEGVDDTFIREERMEHPATYYIHLCDYEIAYSNIEQELCATRHQVIEQLKSNICKPDCQKVTDEATNVGPYDSVFKKIVELQKSSQGIEKKSSALYQKAVIRIIEDLMQVERMEFVKNRNQLTPLLRNAEHARWRAGRAPMQSETAAWEAAAIQNRATLDAWKERKKRVEEFQKNHNAKKVALGLSIDIPTPIGEEIKKWLEEAHQEMSFLESHGLIIAYRETFSRALDAFEKMKKLERKKDVEQWKQLQTEHDDFGDQAEEAYHSAVSHIRDNSMLSEQERNNLLQNLITHHAEKEASEARLETFVKAVRDYRKENKNQHR